MMSCMVFNHHSLPFDSPDKADEAVPDFLKLCIRAQSNGISTFLVDESVDKNWFRLELCGHYFWQDWYGRHNTDENKRYKDLIRAFRSIATRQPFFSMEDIRDNVDLFEVTFEGNSSFSALRAAAWHDAPLTGFPTRPLWTVSPLTVTVETLDETEEIVSEVLELLNFYSLESFELTISDFLEKRNVLIHSGKELFRDRKTLFPYLTLCDNALQQLNNWSASTTILKQAKESLTVLNRFCEMWDDGRLDAYSHEILRDLGLNHRVSGESESVLKNSGLRSKREFWLPEGRKELFENHIKLSKGYRLHFFPDNPLKHIYVGYIGPHLKLK